jgi:hypothetical protein
MTKLRTAMIVAGSAAALVLPASGPAARNIKAKPDPAICAAARAQSQILPGCPRPEGRDSTAARSAAPAPGAAPADAARARAQPRLN